MNKDVFRYFIGTLFLFGMIACQAKPVGMEALMPTMDSDMKPIEIDPEVVKLQATCAQYLGTMVETGQVVDACLGPIEVGDNIVWGGVVSQKFAPGMPIILDDMRYLLEGSKVTTTTTRLAEGIVGSDLKVTMKGDLPEGDGQSTLTLIIGSAGFCALAEVIKEPIIVYTYVCEGNQVEGLPMPDRYDF